MAGHSNGWSDIPSKKEANIKGGEKTMGGKIKKIKKRKKKKKKKEKRRTKGKEGKEGGEEDKTERKKKEKRVGIKYLNKRKYCVGTEPSALVYICILVTFTTTGHDGSVVSALASQAKGRGSIPSYGTCFFFPQVFSIFPFQPPLGK